MFKFLDRVHYYLLSKKYIRGLYGFLHTKYVNAKKYTEYVRFSLFNKPSRLNRDNIGRYLGGLPIDTDKDCELSALIHVTFHFDKSRLVYLKEVVTQLNRLAFSNKAIVVDTNTHELSKYIKGMDLNCEINVHDQLAHPFRLTWAHRESMKKNSENYDIFLYLEDDIFIPNSTIYRWLEDKDRLKKHGFLPGFTRVEIDRKENLIASDYEYTLSKNNVIQLDGRSYLATPFPYQACWMFDRESMREFIDSYSFTNGYPGYEKHNWIRENAAIGLAYESPPGDYPSRHLIALDDTGKISRETLVFHLPCNYGISRTPHPAGLGTVQVDDIL